MKKEKIKELFKTKEFQVVFGITLSILLLVVVIALLIIRDLGGFYDYGGATFAYDESVELNECKFPEDMEIEFKDKGIEAAVRENCGLDKEKDEPILQKDLKEIVMLDTYVVNDELNIIETLEDLQYFPNLQNLVVNVPYMETLEPIDCDSLLFVNLIGPALTDISTLKDLSNLRTLYLQSASIVSLDGVTDNDSIQTVILDNCICADINDIKKLIDKRVSLDISGSR